MQIVEKVYPTAIGCSMHAEGAQKDPGNSNQPDSLLSTGDIHDWSFWQSQLNAEGEVLSILSLMAMLFPFDKAVPFGWPVNAGFLAVCLDPRVTRWCLQGMSDMAPGICSSIRCGRLTVSIALTSARSARLRDPLQICDVPDQRRN